ncbi:S-layer homology domain-containing protein [Paenibacillus sp. FSL H8-0079]|uniref:S-layer homology domain-containing protein n=1 Tax=Paenibacillus sp. FSL H8-0079 TaxID=2921375 RepID=UPI0030ECCA91
MIENHIGDGTLGPYLIITYSEIVNIEITGVEDGGLYNTNVTPQFNTGSATLNGSPITSGTQVTAEGSYTLTVTAGSQTKTIQFLIVKTPPTGTFIVNQGNQYTNSSSVRISISPDAGLTDITHIQYSVNGNPITQIPYVPSFLLAIGSTDGDKVLTFKLVDRAGNQSVEYSSTVTLDTVPPTGTVAINGGAAYATDREVTLGFTLGAGVTDVVAVQFSNDNATWSAEQTYEANTGYTLPAGDGSKTVYVQFIDRAGNTGAAQASIVLDTTAPTGTLTLITPSVTNATTVLLTVTSSNTDYMELGETGQDYGDPVVYSASPQSYTLQDTEEDGVKTLQIRLSDLAGNTTVLTQTVTLDREVPTGTVVVNEGKAYANDSDVAVEVTPEAGVTDIVNIRYSVNGSAPTNIAYTNNFTIDVGSTDGAKAIILQLIDGAGNESVEYSSTVTLDTVPPTGTVAINGGAAYATDREVTLGFTLGAGVTDVVAVQFSNDDATWSAEQIYEASMSYTLPAGDGSKTVYVRIIDRAENIGSAQASIVLDTTAPIVTGVTDGASYNSSRTITFNEGTATLNGQNFISGSPVDVEGSYVLVVTDAAGNSITLAFTIIKYSVGYDGNGATGGEVPLDSQTYEAGSSVTVADNVGSLVKTGFTLIGWNTEADGSGKSYVANDTFHINEADVMLYAKWSINNSSNNNGGGSNPPPPQNSIPVPTPNPQPTPEEPKPEPEPPVVTFDDLSGHWAKGMIEELASQGIIAGYPDGSFHPNEHIKRHHMALIFTRAFEFKPIREAVSFSDVSPSHPYYEAIMSLQQAGIVDGANGNFNPNHSLTRAEMAKILTLAFEIKPGGTVAFQDVPTTHWSYDYIAALAELEIVLGDNGKFKPDEPVTRAQFVAMMYRALNVIQ